jgi:hypothetical protein
VARQDAAAAAGPELVSVIPALAAAMATILLQLSPEDRMSAVREGDELRLWLVAAILGALMR